MVPVKPTTVIEKLKSTTLKKAQDNVKMLANLKETKEYSELESLYDTGIEPVKHGDLSGAIKGKGNIFNHLRELLESAKREVVICISASEINEKSRIFSSLFSVLKKRKIDVKIAVYGSDQEVNKINLKFKIQAKQLNLNSSFFIIDREQILFLISSPSSTSEETGIWINSEFFVSSVSYLFEQAWKR